MENQPTETAPASSDPQAGARRGIEIFRAADGIPLSDTQMPMEGVDGSVMAGFTQLMDAGAGEAEGEYVRCLFREPADDGLSLCYAWFKSGFILPRHSHSSDCVYYVMGGELKLGKQTLRKGDGFFVPNGSAYSYQAGPDGVEVLEFRNAARFNILFKNNDDSHWGRMADAFRDNALTWKSEQLPPSDR